MKFPTHTAIMVSATTTIAFAFAPPQYSVVSKKQIKSPRISRSKSVSSLCLLPDPSVQQGITSAIESSSIMTSDLIDGIYSSIGSLLLLGSVGAGVYAGVMEETAEKNMDEGTADDMVPVEMSAKPVLDEVPDVDKGAEKIEETVEEAATDVDEVVDEEFVESAVAAATTVAATSEKVLQSTEKAIKEVQRKGVAETKEKMSSKSAAAADSISTTPIPSPVEESKAVVVSQTGDDKAVGKKRKVVKGIALMVAAAGVVAVRKIVQAWVGRGMI